MRMAPNGASSLTNHNHNGHFDGFDFRPRYYAPRTGTPTVTIQPFVFVRCPKKCMCRVKDG